MSEPEFGTFEMRTGTVRLIVAKKMFDQWADWVGAHVRVYAEDAARNQGGRLSDAAPTFTHKADGVHVEYTMTRLVHITPAPQEPTR